MKHYLLVFSILLAGLASCKKSDNSATVAAQAATDDAAIQAYIKANYSTTTFTKDPSGLYYAVTKTGTGAYPSSTSNVSVSYTGTILNGSVFETSPSQYIPLSTSIQGWQIGLTHVNDGGSIILLIPSALGYGATANGAVPANSCLLFTIGLQGFN